MPPLHGAALGDPGAAAGRWLLPAGHEELHRFGAPSASSFIRRCWWHDRGCYESNTCSDMRALFEAREEVDKLPPPGECKKPKYIVEGSRYRYGFMEGNRVETIHFPGEEWHKCCMTEGEHPKLQCQRVDVIEHGQVISEHDGYCGVHKCTGPRDRCLLVDRQEEDYKAKKRGECPKGCWKECKKTTHRLECVYIGKEPPHGNEGEEVPKGLYEEPLKYEVYSLRAPAAAALLGAPAALAARGGRAGPRRTRAWSGFLG